MPGKIRVSALAKELGITSKQALAALTELGEPGKTASSTVDQDTADRVRQQQGAAEPDATIDPVAAAGPVPAAASEAAPVADEPPAAPAKKAARKRAAKKTADVPDAVTEPVVVDGAAATAAQEALTPPADETAAPAKKTRKRTSRKAAPAAADEPNAADTTGATADPAGPAMAAPGVLFIAPTAEEAAAAAKATADGDDAGTPEDGDAEDLREAASEQASGARRRRRRGRRGRGGSGAGNADNTENTDADSADGDSTAGDTGTSDDTGTADSDAAGDNADSTDDNGDEGGTTSRRRRRRRRSDPNASGSDDDGDDPPNTVTHVREPKKKGGRGGGGGSNNSSKDDDGDDGVRGVKGSTRLEAKRQRRRDGRDTSRRRAPILTEAEFLARREAVDRVMAVRQRGDRTQIAVLEDDVLVEHYVTRASATSYVGNVYLGRVQNVLPSMEAAFIDIGKGRNGVLYAGEVNWDAAGLEGKSRAIEQALKSGDPVLVQVTKDPIGHKGARLTSQVSLPGRFVVYVPGGGMTGISRRLPDAERHRLKAILKKIVPEDAGVIVRTAAEGASEEDLTRDVERLQAQWEQIQQKSEAKKSAPVLVHGEPDLAVRVVRDVFNEDFKSLVVEGDNSEDGVWQTVSEYIGGVAPDLAERVSRHTKDTDLFHDLRIDEQLMKALDRKVWLPSGGSLVIDRTEAMTVVDVNTGKFIGSGGNLEQTVTRNNLEAAEEVVRQLRLRDVGGIIVIDFIDMVLESNRELVLRRLTECLGRDRTKHQVAEVTSLGLVQMTRKRVGEGLLEAFSEPCEHCRGRGVVVHGEPVDQPSDNGNGNGGGNGSSDDDRPKGKRRRGGRGSQNNTSGADTADDPTVSPAVNEERRRAAAAAIAAIHRAAEGGDDAPAGESAEVAELATGLVEAAQRVEDTQATASTPSTDEPATEAPADPTQEAVVTTAASEVGTPLVTPPTEQPAEEPAEQSAEQPRAEGASIGASNGTPARRRRRAASRPAGPPVATPDGP